MYFRRLYLSAIALMSVVDISFGNDSAHVGYVTSFMEVGNDDRVIPSAVISVDMPQLDKYIDSCNFSNNYLYPRIQSFSHVQKSDGGGTDFQDTLPLSLNQGEAKNLENYPDPLSDSYSGNKELSEVDISNAGLFDFEEKVVYAASERSDIDKSVCPKDDRLHLSDDFSKVSDAYLYISSVGDVSLMLIHTKGERFIDVSIFINQIGDKDNICNAVNQALDECKMKTNKRLVFSKGVYRFITDGMMFNKNTISITYDYPKSEGGSDILFEISNNDNINVS